MSNPYDTDASGAFREPPQDHIGKELHSLRQGLAAQLQDALAALHKEQEDNDNFRRELGYDPIGPDKVYSGPELAQHRGRLRVSHWVGNGMQTQTIVPTPTEAGS